MKSDFLTNLFFRALQTVGIAAMIVRLLLPVAIVAALYLLWRIARNLEKPPKLTEEVKIVRKSLSEMLKENRTRCKMTQEFVAETIGGSRQAVYKTLEIQARHNEKGRMTHCPKRFWADMVELQGEL